MIDNKPTTHALALQRKNLLTESPQACNHWVDLKIANAPQRQKNMQSLIIPRENTYKDTLKQTCSYKHILKSSRPLTSLLYFSLLQIAFGIADFLSSLHG